MSDELLRELRALRAEVESLRLELTGKTASGRDARSEGKRIAETMMMKRRQR